jgi:hypothetical protein
MAFNRTLTRNIGNSLTTVRTSSANGDVVIGLRITNTTASPIKVSACVTNGGLDYYLVGGATVATMGADIPVGGSLVIINGDADKVNLISGDTIRVIGSAATCCDAIVSVLEN